IRFRLTGVPGTDPSDASGTNLFDVRRGNWSRETLNALGVPPDWLPPVADSAAVSGDVAKQSASRTGLPAGVPVVTGASDQAAAAIGCGVVEPGTLAIILGTSAVVSAASPDAVIDPSGAFHTFCHALPGTWQIMGGVLSAGGAVQWYRDKIAAESVDGYAAILDDARAVSPGADGLIFLPYLTGERAPHNDPQARGGWIGLTARHDRRHLARAVLEGVCFALRQLVERIEETGPRASTIRVAGGGVRGGLWLDILASMLARPVTPVATPDASAQGAAMLAIAGLTGAHLESLAADWVRAEEPICPRPGDVDYYDQMYAIFSALYPATRQAMHRLSAIDRNQAE
ncbi:MAG: xylulokinase, partial [Inquilinus sp.]|nr:xylulokinase [Inquilinus sp.]